jgi:hypothetical protein
MLRLYSERTDGILEVLILLYGLHAHDLEGTKSVNLLKLPI